MIHAFVICAYKENPHLEDTIKCLKEQTIQSPIYLSTSTPNAYISNLALKYDIKVYENPVSKGSGSDWNFAYKIPDAEYITLVHQDDYYEPSFAEKTLEAAKQNNDAIIIFTDYFEMRETGPVTNSQFLRIKRVMNRTMSLFPGWKTWRRLVLGFGSPICCPAVTYHKSKIGDFEFRTDYQNSHDWEAYCRLAKYSGTYVYISEQLVGHRIYTDSQTTKSITNGIRAREDMEILQTVWPKPIANMIMRFYGKSMDNNG